MYIAMLSFAFPFKIMLLWFFSKRTGREFSLKYEDYFDLILAFLVAWWFEKFEEYSHKESSDPRIANTPEEIFMANIIEGIDTGEFHFDFLLACVAGMFWGRMLLMMKLTKTFGPMIKIIVVMLKELTIFLVLWLIQLFIFTCIGILVFGELPEYYDFLQALIWLFESSMGEWQSLAPYENLSLGKEVGQVFHLIVIILNLILLLNTVIAILSETYVRYSQMSLGLYYDGVIAAIPAYKYNKYYGALVCAPPPVNLIMIPVLPFFQCMDSLENLKILNKFMCTIAYLPFGGFVIVFFFAVNILLIPVAYIYAVYTKWVLIF